MNWRTRIFMVMVALDVFLFACACLGNVKRGETASAAAWSLYLDRKWQGRVFVPMIDGLFYVLARETDHCRKSYFTFMRNRFDD